MLQTPEMGRSPLHRAGITVLSQRHYNPAKRRPFRSPGVHRRRQRDRIGIPSPGEAECQRPPGRSPCCWPSPWSP